MTYLLVPRLFPRGPAGKAFRLLPLLAIGLLVFFLSFFGVKAWHRSVASKKTGAYKPVRFVSCSPHATALVFELGQQHRLLGVSPQVTHPREAQDWPRVACPQTAPAVVDVDTGFRWLGLSASLNKPASNFYSFEDVFAWMVDMGAAMQQTGSTHALIDRIRSDLQRIHAENAHGTYIPRVAFVYPSSSGDNQTLWVAGAETPEQDALFYAHAKNVFSDQSGYPHTTVAALLDLRPDWVVIHPAARSTLPEEIEKQGVKVIKMDSSGFVSARLAQATDQLARHIHTKT